MAPRTWSCSPSRARRARSSGSHRPPATIVESVFGIGVTDPMNPNMGVRSGQGLPSAAVDRTTGQIYVVWEDSRFSTDTERDNIALVSSQDGGLTWSQPIQVDQNDAP